MTGSRALTPICIMAAALACHSHGDDVAVERGTFQGRPIVALDNGLIRLAVTPEIGGRVLELQMHDSSSIANLREDNIHRAPADSDWVGAEYGGFADAGTSGWPGPFWPLTYELDIERDASSGAVTLVGRGEAEDQAVTRRMTVTPGSTAVRFDMVQENLLEIPQQMTLRLHCEMAAGALADNNDRLFFRTDDRFEVMPFVVGAEYARFRWMTLDEPWVAVLDAEEQEGVVRRFNNPADNPKLFYWVGFNESPQTLGEQGAFFSLDWFAREQVVEPGGQLAATESLFLVSGISRIGFVNGQSAGGLVLDRSRYGHGAQAAFTVALASATQRPAATARIVVRRGDTTLKQIETRIAGSDPGVAGSSTVSWTVAELQDGPVEVEAEFRDADGAWLGTDRQTLTIANAVVDSARSSLDALQQQVEALRSLARQSGLLTRLDVSTELDVAEVRIDQVQKHIAGGQYEHASQLADQAAQTVRNLIDRLGNKARSSQ